MDFRTYSDEELRAFLRAGCTSFDNKKLAEREALTRFVRHTGPDAEDDLEQAYDRGYKAGGQMGYADGLKAGRAESE